jgi:hypothetical protein
VATCSAFAISRLRAAGGRKVINLAWLTSGVPGGPDGPDHGDLRPAQQPLIADPRDGDRCGARPVVACWDAKYAYRAMRPFQVDPELKTTSSLGRVDKVIVCGNAE